MESQIENLRQKYWEGKTSVEEESILKNLLKNESANSEEKMFFSEIEKQKAIKSNHQFSFPRRRNRSIWKIFSLAASILILVAFAFNYDNFNKQDQFIVDDPEMAFEISQQALMFVSTQLNKGKTYTAQMDKINEVKQIINK
jgi:hypothetical protein